MAEDEDPSETVTRLEAALERIAQAARTARAEPRADVQPAVLAPGADTAELTARLDVVIARLRSALGPNPDQA